MYLVLIAIIAAAASAAPSAPGCCTPTQWEGMQGAIVGRVENQNPSVYDQNTAISYDEINKKIAYNVYLTVPGQKVQNYKIIQDYTKEMQYMINVNTQTCQPSQLPPEFQKICLPADAKPQGKFYFGLGNTKLDAVSFSVFSNNGNITIVMTPDDCVPILEITTVANAQMAMMQALGFVNLTPGIKDSNVFNVPDICSQRKPVSFGEALKRTGLFTSKFFH